MAKYPATVSRTSFTFIAESRKMGTINGIIKKFSDWYAEELSLSKATVPSACCLSTTGLDGFPNARFVSLKEVTDSCFIVTGPCSSRKGMEIERSNKVALTFWWGETERQVRVQGLADKIPPSLADKYFYERSEESQVVSMLSRQGAEMADINILISECREFSAQAKKDIARPADWGGYFIAPVRIEFLAFNITRFHHRILYEKTGGTWSSKYIQP